MDTMSWFGVLYYIALFGGVYIIVRGFQWAIKWSECKDYINGYNDGFEQGVDEGIDLTWSLAYREGRQQVREHAIVRRAHLNNILETAVPHEAVSGYKTVKGQLFEIHLLLKFIGGE